MGIAASRPGTPKHCLTSAPSCGLCSWLADAWVTGACAMLFSGQVWAAYSPVKNSPPDARAKAAAGSPSHSATTGELDIYQANCRWSPPGQRPGTLQELSCCTRPWTDCHADRVALVLEFSTHAKPHIQFLGLASLSPFQYCQPLPLGHHWRAGHLPGQLQVEPAWTGTQAYPWALQMRPIAASWCKKHGAKAWGRRMFALASSQFSFWLSAGGNCGP